MKRPIIRVGERYRVGAEGQTTSLVKRIGKYGRGPATDANDPALLVRDTLTGRAMTQAQYASNNPNYRLTVTMTGAPSGAPITVTNTATGAVLLNETITDSWLSGPLPSGTPLTVEGGAVSGYTTPTTKTLVLTGDMTAEMKYTAVYVPSPTRTTDRNQIPWETTRVQFTGADLDAGVHGPILGDGSIQLNPRSVKWTVPGQPTVSIPGGYGRPLRFDGWNLSGAGGVEGTGNAGIVWMPGGNRAIFTETMFFGQYPGPGYGGGFCNRAVQAMSPKRLDMMGSMLFHTSGIQAVKYRSTGVSEDGVYLARNYAEDIDGRKVLSDGTLNNGEDTAGKRPAQFIQLDNCIDIPFRAEDNHVRKTPGSTAASEDIYSPFSSTPALGYGQIRRFLTAHISPHDPIFDANPAYHFYGMRADGTPVPYFGGPGLAGDGGRVGGNTGPLNATTVPHHWVYEDGYVIGGCGGYFLGIPTGNHNGVYRTKIIAVGAFRNPNSPYGWTRYYPAGPAIYISNYWEGTDPSYWGFHEVKDNLLFVATTRSQTATTIKWATHSYVNNPKDPNAAVTGNTFLNPPGTRLSGTASNGGYSAPLSSINDMLDRQDAYEQEWHDMQAAAGRVIGCRL